jgi:NAD(P)-dependent dehydrogenase (short-subunit alcohol dehydrogenase family)
MRLKGKTVLVTAAGQGIGKASGLAMAAEGAKVWATDVMRSCSPAVRACRTSIRRRLMCLTTPPFKNFIARQPMGRLAQAHEIAPLIVFLASDESAFVTGQAYGIDGGMTI